MGSGFVQFAGLLFVMGWLNIWLWWRAKKSSGSGGGYDYVPLCLTLVSTVFIVISPLRNIVFYIAMNRYERSGKIDSITERCLDITVSTPLCSAALTGYTLLAYVLLGLAVSRYLELDKSLGWFGNSSELTETSKAEKETACQGGS